MVPKSVTIPRYLKVNNEIHKTYYVAIGVILNPKTRNKNIFHGCGCTHMSMCTFKYLDIVTLGYRVIRHFLFVYVSSTPTYHIHRAPRFKRKSKMAIGLKCQHSHTKQVQTHFYQTLHSHFFQRTLFNIMYNS